MSEYKKLLEHVQKTNPDMTMKRLKKELCENRASSLALIMVWRNGEKQGTYR